MVATSNFKSMLKYVLKDPPKRSAARVVIYLIEWDARTFPRKQLDTRL